MNRRILALAVPSIAANITTPLLGMVDTAITGHMGDARYIAAIAVGGVMFNMLYWLFGFLRAGTAGLAAQACGANDMKQSALTLYRSLLVAVAVAFLMLILQQPLTDLLLWIVKPDPVTEPLARQYFTILIWGAPAMLTSYALTGWFLGMQNSRINLFTSLIINITNIAASLWLVLGLKWKVAGVATGTLIAQWTGLIVALLFVRRYKLPHVTIHEVSRWHEIKRFFKINVLIMLRTVFIILTTVWFTRAGAMQGSIVLAVNTMLMQLFMLFSFVMDGFAYAAEALIGKSTGAHDTGSQHECVRDLFRWGWIMSGAFTVIYYIGGEEFLHLLCSDSMVINASAEYWWWAITVPLAGFAGFVWDGVYIGATMVRELFLTMAVAVAAFFIVYFSLYSVIGNHGLWAAFVIYLLTRGIGQWIIYNRMAR